MSEEFRQPESRGTQSFGPVVNASRNEERARRDALAAFESDQRALSADTAASLRELERMAETRRADDGGDTGFLAPESVPDERNRDRDFQAGRDAAERLRGATERAERGALNALEDATLGQVGKVADAVLNRGLDAVGLLPTDAAGREQDIPLFSELPGAVGAIIDALGDEVADAIRGGEDEIEQQIPGAENPALRDAFRQAQREALEALQAEEVGSDSDPDFIAEERRGDEENRGGPCDYNGQFDAIGRRCGGRSAMARPGGRFG